MDEQHQPQVLATENGIVSENFKGDREKGLHLMAQTGAWFLGKHRMKVAISDLNNQIDTIQEELEELEIIGESAIACKNVISSIESIPDPLLTLTRGPVDANWYRWFGGSNHNSTSHNQWI